MENCIKTLAEVAKSRGIAIPSELDIQVATMFSKQQLLSRQTTSKWLQATRSPKRDLSSSSGNLAQKRKRKKYRSKNALSLPKDIVFKNPGFPVQ